MMYTGMKNARKKEDINMNFGSNNMMWILLLLLILGDGNNGGCASCDTFIWLLLLSRYCGGNDMGCGCGGGTIGRSCGV